GGKRPFGYQVDKTTHILIVDENTVTDTHDAIIHTKVWEQAQAILDAWGESHAHCAASGSDYVLTGRLRCPRCGKAMIGTRATGRNKTYQLLHVLEPRPLRRQQMRLQTPQRR
ncbi:MAG: zinc ribbon domain-containing protein, partial [Sciscionella sp.]